MNHTSLDYTYGCQQCSNTDPEKFIAMLAFCFLIINIFTSLFDLLEISKKKKTLEITKQK